MARDELTLMPRGETFTFYDSAGAVDATGGSYLEGAEKVFEDIDYSVYGTKTLRSGKSVHCRLTRNASGSTLLPKRFAKYKIDGTTTDVYGGQISGYGTTVGDVGGIIDEFLPAAGIVANALFWLVVEGPTKVTSDTTGDVAVTIGNCVIPGTSGRVLDQDITVAAGAATFNQIQGAIGRALETMSVTATDYMILVRRMI